MTIKDSNNNANQTRWAVYRFELVFFNSRENRWQLFQESSNHLAQPTDPQGFYRQQIYLMLNDIRNVFGHMFENTIFRLEQPTNRSVTVDLAGLGRGFTTSNAKNRDRQTIVADIKTSLKAEGIEETENVTKLLGAIEDANYGSYRLKYQEALDLMTCLPFRRPWDIYGRLDAFHPEFPTLPPVSINPWFTYKISIPPSRNIQTNCERLLGYSVELDFPKAKPEYLGSFYRFCRDIRKLRSRQAQWYACYGHLVDRIQFGLSAKKATFVAAFPLRICGWDHYLQVYFSPLHEKDSTAIDLADDLATIGFFKKPIGMTILKECIREFLVQIRIAAFQGYVSHEITDIPLPKLEEDEIHKWIGALFCRHAHNLVQVEWMRCEEKWFGYPMPRADQTPAWDLLKKRPKDAENGHGDHKVTVGNGHVIEALVPWEAHYTEDFGRALDPVFGGTSRQRLEEQLGWLTRRVLNRQTVIQLLNEI